MYMDVSSVRTNGKTYTRVLLRDSYREGGKVKHRTFANLSHCSAEEIQAMRLALKHKGDLAQLSSAKDSISCEQGPSIGASWLVYQIALDLGIVSALGTGRQAQLALWQIMARVIDQGSRLSAVRLAAAHAACDILPLDSFHEEHLYQNLDWLAENQAKVEDRLRNKRKSKPSSGLFLYDVTSSYFEGTHNELAAFGYNRDGKRGKKQIVIGLLCDSDGVPLSIEVFKGNTQDPKTLSSQVKKVADRFGGGDVTFVGDRGMIKSKQVEELSTYNRDEFTTNHFHYITAITEPQVRTLLKANVLQLSLFDSEVAEVIGDDYRYVFRRNPIRAREVQTTRSDKFTSLLRKVAQANEYLRSHPRAKVSVALRNLNTKAKALKIDKWIKLDIKKRAITLEEDSTRRAETSMLDGCYVLKTDLTKDKANKHTIHARYKDLALVESAFRSSKTDHLEMRPIFVRLESRTRGHAFVVMLAYLITQELRKRWCDLDTTVEEGINELAHLCATTIQIKATAPLNQIPRPRSASRKLLSTANVRLPKVLPSRGIEVTTKKKLTSERKPT